MSAFHAASPARTSDSVAGEIRDVSVRATVGNPRHYRDGIQEAPRRIQIDVFLRGAVRGRLGGLAIVLACLIGAISPVRGEIPRDIHAMFDVAEQEGRVGIARKSRLVDVRPAVPGEVIVTIISGEGRETQSRPAVPGDKVVRNRCPATGNEEYLVGADAFAKRYEGPIGHGDGEGWRPYRPRGTRMRYMRVRPTDGAFTFTAPWGEAMVARPGDVIVRDPANRNDTYRVAALSFECTYEIIEAAESRP